jgi:hypothetical protein
METTLHRQLKAYFGSPGCQFEVRIGRFRIDVVNGDRLVEIQHSSLSSLRRKIAALLETHFVDVVKPLIVEKTLVMLNRKYGTVISVRRSPKHESFIDFADELIYFSSIFPHPRLRVLVPEIEIREIRFPGQGRRRRKRAGDHQVQDRELVKINCTQVYATATDLLQNLPEISGPFDTQKLADALGVRRWQGQKLAYVLRQTGAIEMVGKIRNSKIYQPAVGVNRKTQPRSLYARTA